MEGDYFFLYGYDYKNADKGKKEEKNKENKGDAEREEKTIENETMLVNIKERAKRAEKKIGSFLEEFKESNEDSFKKSEELELKLNGINDLIKKYTKDGYDLESEKEELEKLTQEMNEIQKSCRELFKDTRSEIFGLKMKNRQKKAINGVIYNQYFKNKSRSEQIDAVKAKIKEIIEMNKLSQEVDEKKIEEYLENKNIPHKDVEIKKPEAVEKEESISIGNKVEKSEENKGDSKSISRKERILKEIQDPDYYGDPLEDSDNRELYHAYHNFSKEEQRDMFSNNGSHIDTLDDITKSDDDMDVFKKKEKSEENKENKEREKNVIEDIKNEPDRIVIIDMEDKITGIAEDCARVEISNKKPKGFLGGLKNFFSNAISYDIKFARKRSIAEKNIYTSENLFANNENNTDKKVSEIERQALIERVNKGFLLEGEKLEDLKEDTQNKIKDVIKKYVFHLNNFSENELKDSVSDIMSEVFEEDLKRNEKLAKAFKIDIKQIFATKYANNILNLSNRIKKESKELIKKDPDAVNKRIEKIEIKKANVFGGQLTTEKLNRVEGFFDKTLRKAPILSSLDYVAVSVGTIIATTVARTAATSMTAGVGGVAFGTAISGIKESRKIEKDRAQVAREAAIGYESSMYDEKMESYKKIAKLSEIALDKNGNKEEIIKKIKDLKSINIDKGDSFSDIYLKMCKFDMKSDKEIFKIMKEIDSICKKYYKGEKLKEYIENIKNIENINKEYRTRETIKQFVYEQRPAKEINKFLNIEDGELTPDDFRFVFGNLLDAMARQTLSASYRIDLIEFSDKNEIERERTLLALNIANAKSRLRKQFNLLSEEDKKKIFDTEYENIKDKDFDQILNKYINNKIEDFKTQKEKIDDLYKKYKKKEISKRALITTVVNIVFILTGQEIGALFDSKTYGFLERVLHKGAGMNGPQKQTILDYLAGGLLQKNGTNVTNNLDNAYRMLDSAVGKDGIKIEQIFNRNHFNNNTNNPDLNELKLGLGKTGEKIIASMRGMVNGGSFRNGVFINPGDKNLVFKLLISLSDSSKHTPISIPFDASGNAIIPDSLKFLFGSNGEFLGKYAEVAAFDKAGNVLGILATHIGKGISGSTVTNTITNFTNPAFFGAFIPTFRKPLERTEKHKQEIKRKPNNILKKKEDIIQVAKVDETKDINKNGESVMEKDEKTVIEKYKGSENNKAEKGDIVEAILEEMKKILDEKRLQNLKMFRVATFILKKYGNPEKLEVASKIKNKEQRRDAYREIMLESWKEFAIHKKPDLDCHGVLFLLDAAGFKINNVSVLDKGDVKKDTVNFDTGSTSGFETIRHKDNDNKIKYDYAVVDHHGKDSDIESSSTKYLYEFLIALGFIQDKTGYLKAIVDFITKEDNKDYEFTEKDYRNSSSNLFGYSGYINQENLTKLLNDEDIKNKYLKISNVKYNFNIGFMNLSNNDLKRLGLFEYKQNRMYAIAKTIDSMKKLEEKNKKLKENNEDRLIYEIGKYNVLINENYIIKFPTDIAIAKGYNVIINYSNTDNKFSASFIKNSMPKLSDEFRKKMEEYGIINVRNSMLIKDLKNKKAKPIDKDFIYGPNGLINELKK